MKPIRVVEFRDRPHVVLKTDESTDTVSLAEWDFPLRSYLLKEFHLQLTQSVTISQTKFAELPCLLEVE